MITVNAIIGTLLLEFTCTGKGSDRFKIPFISSKHTVGPLKYCTAYPVALKDYVNKIHIYVICRNPLDLLVFV
jgi:hypothetical protein